MLSTSSEQWWKWTKFLNVPNDFTQEAIESLEKFQYEGDKEVWSISTMVIWDILLMENIKNLTHLMEEVKLGGVESIQGKIYYPLRNMPQQDTNFNILINPLMLKPNHPSSSLVSTWLKKVNNVNLHNFILIHE